RRNRHSAFFGLCLLFSLNIMAVSWIFDLDLLERFLTGDPLMDRWIIIPIVTSPILLGIYFYYRANKSKVESIMNELDTDEALRKKQKIKVIVYVVLTVIIWISTIFVPPLQLV